MHAKNNTEARGGSGSVGYDYESTQRHSKTASRCFAERAEARMLAMANAARSHRVCPILVASDEVRMKAALPESRRRNGTPCAARCQEERVAVRFPLPVVARVVVCTADCHEEAYYPVSCR